MLGSVHEVDPPHVVAGLLGRKRFVERSLGVRVQIVADQRDPLDAGVARIEQMGDFMSPIVLGAARPGRSLPEAGDWFGAHKNTSPSLPFAFVFYPSRLLL